MKFCPDHWNKLRAAIDAHGLKPYTADTGELVLRKLVSQVEVGKVTRLNYDPLMDAHNNITAQLIGIGGLVVMMDNPDGSERCPLCFANQEHQRLCTEAGCTFSYDEWIEAAADDEYQQALALGVITEYPRTRECGCIELNANEVTMCAHHIAESEAFWRKALED